MGIVIVKDVLSEVIEGTGYPGLIGNARYIVDYLENNPGIQTLIAIQQPISEIRGGDYVKVSIDYLLFLTQYGREQNLQDRDDITFKPVLIPLYESFMSKLVEHKNVVETEWETLPGTVSLVPTWQPPESGLQQYFDAIVITQFQFKITQQNC